MQKYESKQGRICRPAAQIYTVLSDFSNFTPIVKDKVENWQADADSCSFKVQGFTVGLRIVERVENSSIKVEGQDGSPFDFTFWLQMKEVDQNDTRIRLVLHIKLNMMMKMMIGGKIQQALDQMVDQMSSAFNATGDLPHTI